MGPIGELVKWMPGYDAYTYHFFTSITSYEFFSIPRRDTCFIISGHNVASPEVELLHFPLNRALTPFSSDDGEKSKGGESPFLGGGL
jgi:hypothetical protein